VKHPLGKLPDVIGDETGETMVEYGLLVATFGMLMIPVLWKLLAAMAEHYKMVSTLVTFPFP